MPPAAGTGCMPRASRYVRDRLGGLSGRFNLPLVEELARVVAQRVDQVARAHARDRIDVVGHSEGGLIGRAIS